MSEETIRISNTAGIFLVILPSPGEMEVRTVLVLGKSELVEQADGTIFSKPRMWGLPKGRMKPDIDEDVVATALRELWEETGIIDISREMLSAELSATEKEKSLRPGSDEHNKTFFLAVMKNMPKIGVPVDPKIEKAQIFSLSELPISGGTKLAKSHARAMSVLWEKCQPRLLAEGVNPMVLAMCDVNLSYKPGESKSDPDEEKNNFRNQR
jgi:8-oxo-dGTP pyrophosphatase MutT (NUDIX family)